MATAVRRIALQMLQKKIGGAGGPRGECSSQQLHSIAWQIVLMTKKAGPPDDAKVVAKKRRGRPARGGAAPSAEAELRPRQHISMSEGDPPDDANGCSDISSSSHSKTSGVDMDVLVRSDLVTILTNSNLYI